MTNEIFIGRQAILDSERQTFGYELLHRDGQDTAPMSDSPDVATRCVMERALLQWGMEKIIGNRFGLINASASLIVSGLHRAMPPEGIIFEICEPTPFNGPTYDALVRARHDGYHFALDNVTRLAHLVGSRLLPHASIVKIELRNAFEDEIPRLIDVARERAPGVLVAAEKVETAADFARSIEFGFDLFQGYFFAKPEVLKRPARPANGASALALLAEMHRTEIDIDRTVESSGATRHSRSGCWRSPIRVHSASIGESIRYATRSFARTRPGPPHGRSDRVVHRARRTRGTDHARRHERPHDQLAGAGRGSIEHRNHRWVAVGDRCDLRDADVRIDR